MAYTKEQTAAYNRAYYVAHREAIKAQVRAYAAEHKEDISQRNKSFRATNKDRLHAKARAAYKANAKEKIAYQKALHASKPAAVKAYKKKWWARNATAFSAQRRAFYAAHTDVERAKQKAWYDKSYHAGQREKFLARNAKRRALKQQTRVEDIDFKQVLKDSKGLCGICRKPLDLFGIDFDHIVPLSKGGTHTRANIQATHARCNRSKGARVG
jgi:hypothetical protein